MKSLNVISFPDEMVDEDPAKLEELRRLSNVIQALENVVVQCSDYEGFAHVREFTIQSLYFYRQQMHRRIHQDSA